MHPTSDAAFRLPLDVRPLGYDAALSVDIDGRRFSGELTLRLQLGRSADELVLHATGLEVTRAVAEGGGA